ncbi:MAG: exosome complex RNA-binding protein Rrp4 [Methanobacterium sp.]
MIFVEDKDLVVPGDVLADDEYHTGRGTFRDGKNICSSLVGLVAVRDKKVSVIPLQSKYIPKRGDVVIGEITDIRFSMWNLDINSPYSGFLPASDVFGKEKRDLNKAFDVGDVLFLRVVDVDEVKKVKLGLKGRGLGKFRGGILIYITPTKVPRLIGKKGSMINMIKDETHCDIIVGQNGVVWVKGDPMMERVAEKVINMIEQQAHTSGLTDRVRNMLSELLGKEIEEEVEDAVEEEDLEVEEVPEPDEDQLQG